MTANPYADDPTVHTQYIGGNWVATGANLTTHDVAAVQDRLATEVERINGRTQLTAQAKRIAIARAYTQARDTINGMRQEAEQQVTRERQRLERKLFGTDGHTPDPGTVMARRDAAAKASAIEEPEQARRMLKRAERDSDTTMAQAIASRAAEMWWGDVLEDYASTRPEAVDTINGLRELPNLDDPVTALQTAMTYSLSPPTEVGGLSDYQVDALAASEMDVA